MRHLPDSVEKLVSAGMAKSPPSFDAAFQQRLIDLFQWRRDVRHFLTVPVPEPLVARLFELACMAPSVGLSQPWRFITVDEPPRRAAIRANFARCNAEALASQASSYARLKLAGLDDAPRQIAVFADPDPLQGHGLGRRTMPETTAYSAVMAIHTLWLFARTLGLGLGWVSILDPAAVTAALDVPPAWVFIGYLCLGYPCADSDTPELERQGWEYRRGAEACVIRR
jgi:5,6-dimethylbenzimidazole synthase